MLVELDIQNFAIIKSVKVQFESKMTVLMGETGAGKSIIIDALSILLGHRASSEMIRTGSDQATVTGLFSVDEINRKFLTKIFEDNGWTLEDEIVIQRQISVKGRNVVRVNGQLSTINVLSELGKYLVDIHGQQDQQILMDETQHINLLDQFGQKETEGLLAEYQIQFEQWKSLTQQLNNLEKNSQKIAQQQDILQFQVNEIDSAKILSADEDQTLEDEYNKLSNFQKITDLASDLQQLFESEDSNVVDQVGTGMSLAHDLARFSNEYQPFADTVSDAYYALDDARSSITQIIDNLDFDEGRFQELNERIILFNNLKKKYGPTLEDVLNFFEEKSSELEQLSSAGFDTEKLRKDITELEVSMSELAQDIHQKRQKVAQGLVKAIQAQLKDLYMSKAKFDVNFEHSNVFLPNGQDIVEFYISPNPGESLKPLVKIASGGEQSRIVLALKVIFGELSPVKTMVFDEIDTGVSGRVAAAIGEKMLSLAQEKQVFAITHAPQVAATANQRYLIEKQVKDDQTFTTLTPLNYDDSILAVAKMIAGSQVTDAAISNAKELLELHKNVK